MTAIPHQLKKYIVPQNYRKYTPEDQAIWRYLMKRIVALQSQYGHVDCVEGMKKTGITFHRIPKISEMDKKLQKFGWRAISVSGFLPPRVFMDFQAHGILPIASELRTLEHIRYTPAPDIVHEAVGHAPFLIHPVFSRFLKEYAKVVKKALVSFQDIKKYEAIRRLSDIKEYPSANKSDIKKAEKHLETVENSIKFHSESSKLSRFIWWTSEYGLIGSLKNPKIYGAGLISSIGEAKTCFSAKVKKIPLSEECLNYPYNITTFQPQLFVIPDFECLLEVLKSIASRLAWQRGGLHGIREALKSRTLNTVELDSGLQISGVLEREIHQKDRVCFLKFSGPCQLSFQRKELSGQGKDYHNHGYSTPLGLKIKPENLIRGRTLKLQFPSGIELRGEVVGKTEKKGRLLLVTFKNCRIKKGGDILYEPYWGLFDLAVGQSVVSVFSGVGDEKAFGMKDSFKPSIVAKRNPSKEQKKRFKIYRAVFSLEEESDLKRKKEKLNRLFLQLKNQNPPLWLAVLELLLQAKDFPQIKRDISNYLRRLKKTHPSLNSLIEEGQPFYKQ